MQTQEPSTTYVRVPEDSLESVVFAIDGFTSWAYKNQEQIARNGATDQTLMSYNIEHCVEDDANDEECRYLKALDEEALPAYYVCPGCNKKLPFCCLIDKAYEAGLDSSEGMPWEKLVCTATDKCMYMGQPCLSIDLQVRTAALKGALAGQYEHLVNQFKDREETSSEKKVRGRSDDAAEDAGDSRKSKRARVCKE